MKRKVKGRVHSTSERKEFIQMNSMDSRNRKIIDAVIRKEQEVCPGSLALIGVYGSFRTGDVHRLSDSKRRTGL